MKQYTNYPKDTFVILDNDCVYPLIWMVINKLFINTSESEIKNITFGIHWYNGNIATKHFINYFDKNNINPENSLFEKLIKNIIK